MNNLSLDAELESIPIKIQILKAIHNGRESPKISTFVGINPDKNTNFESDSQQTPLPNLHHSVGINPDKNTNFESDSQQVTKGSEEESSWNQSR